MDEHSAPETSGSASAKPRRRWRWLAWPLALLVLIGALSWTGYVTMMGRTMAMPGWVTQSAENRINRALDGPRVRLGGVQLSLPKGGLPRLRLRDVGVYDAGGQEIARLAELGARLDRGALWSGDIQPRELNLSGAEITLRRRADGTFDISMGRGLQASGTLAGVLDSIDAAFESAPLDTIQRVNADAVTITLEDARSRRVWQVTGGQLALEHGSDAIEMSVTAEVFNGTEDLAALAFGFRSAKGSPSAEISARFENAAAADIAAQAPVLSFMQLIDAPISGALRTRIGVDGALASLSGTLEIGGGELAVGGGADGLGFDGAQVYLDYDPKRQRISFRDLSLETDIFSAAVTGHAYLRDIVQGVPGTLIGQVALERMDVAPGDLFATPLFFNGGAADFKLGLDPFRLDVGQLLMIDEELRIAAKGRAEATPEGWVADLDLNVDEALPRRLLAFWPLAAVPKTRRWIENNIESGVIRDLNAALRIRPGAEPVIGATLDFNEAEVRFLPRMPPITRGAGYIYVDNDRFALGVEDGEIAPPEGGTIRVASSMIRVDDTSRDPSIMQVNLKTESSIRAALSLINQPPLGIMDRTGRPVDMATGRAVMTTDLAFELLNDLTLDQVDFEAQGLLSGVSSDGLVPNRVLSADRLTLTANREAVEIGGAAQIDSVPLRVLWRQPVGEGDETGQVTGSVALSAETLAAFGIDLPDGAVSGSGQGEFTLDLPDGEPPRLTLTSDLAGIGMAIPALGWQLAPQTTGRFELDARLAETPVVDALSLTAPGLSATGVVSLAEAGGLGAARFDRVRVGDWMEVGAELVGRGTELPPEIRITGGTIDLRALGEGPEVASGGGGSEDTSPLRVALDRLIVSNGITLTAMNGTFSTARGLDGSFGARVNNGTAITGRVAPQNGRSAIRLTSENAGGVMADAGVIPNFRGGQMTLLLTPGAAEGVYEGTLAVRNTRVVEAPAMTELLSAISVVGLIDQMGGEGIGMDFVDADFTLTPTEVRLQSSSATGPSLGITMNGVYQLAGGAMRMQGVVSPVYFLNGIGQIFTRQGEGLFGFNYSLTSNGDETSVGVNPLSILTPGMFREIFRRPPPS